MDFPNALKMMKMGVKMARMEWTDGMYVYLEDDKFMRYIPKGSIPTMFFSEEVLADDWEVVRQEFSV